MMEQFKNNWSSPRSDQDEEVAAKMVITTDHSGFGFFEDLELVIQLIIDQACLKMKLVARRGSHLFSASSYDLGDCSTDIETGE